MLFRSSIGFLENTYVHSYKALPEYYRILHEDKLPVEQGKILSEDDQIRRWTINALMCQFQVDKRAFEKKFKIIFDEYYAQEQEHIRQCVKDQLITIENGMIKTTELGKIFIRNVCMGFDYYLRQENAPTRFSKTI